MPEAKTVKTTVRIPEDLWKAARVRAIEDRADFQDIVIRALAAYLKTSPPRRGGKR